MLNCLWVGLGGFLGSVLRYLLGFVNLHTKLPINTLIINVVGSLAIGVIAALSYKYLDANQPLKLFLKVGVCGGFTTFSTFALETQQLVQNGHSYMAMGYIILSVVLSVLAVAVAERLFQ
ncbi:MAG: fluoride efflux transporter CrcB [Alphaproteobacteria bacterium]|nr:fluoride efflux transporter CrcB [Alphaproteobacteria bacterium]